MNKENVISNFVSGLTCLILSAILMMFISADYTLGLGFLAGVGQRFLNPLVKKVLFKKEN